MSEAARSGWRVFPWDRKAEEGAPFSASFVPFAQGWGRFDLPGDPAGVLYLAETPDHAVGEKIQDLRNQTLDPEDLNEFGHPLALVEVIVPEIVEDGVVDLCDPATLAELTIRPDDLCAMDRTVTQEIARSIRRRGASGFRWWSAFFGEWHTLVLFRDRLPEPPRYESPGGLTIEHPAVRSAASSLGIEIAVRSG